MMARINGLVELLNTLFLSFINNTVMVDKTTLTHIQNCIQYSQDTLEFLKPMSQLQCDELRQKNQDSKIFLVENNAHFEFENDSH